MAECPLCAREPKAPVHYEDDRIWVTECLTCRVPMGVLKRHTSHPKLEEALHLARKIEELFPGRRLDDRMRSIPEHYHMHAR